MQGKKVLHFLCFLSLAQIVGSGRRARVLFLFQKKKKLLFPRFYQKRDIPPAGTKTRAAKRRPLLFRAFQGGRKAHRLILFQPEKIYHA